MTHSTIFKNNKTQAVRLPKAVAFPESVTKVRIIKQGNARLLVPEGGTWEEFWNAPGIDEDFLSDRRQPLPQVRKSLSRKAAKR